MGNHMSDEKKDGKKIWEDFESWRSQAQIDLHLDDSNIEAKALAIPSLYHKYLTKFTDESLELKRLIVEKDRFFGERVKFYKENYPRDLKMTEIERYIDSEREYIEKLKMCKLQETICQFLEGIVKRVQSLGFDIKNYIELRKFLSGS